MADEDSIRGALLSASRDVNSIGQKVLREDSAVWPQRLYWLLADLSGEYGASMFNIAVRWSPLQLSRESNSAYTDRNDLTFMCEHPKVLLFAP